MDETDLQAVEGVPTSLLDLPQHLLILILQQLDTVSICSASRCNRALWHLSCHPSLWPASSTQGPADWALGDVKLALANILALPPQVFQAQLDVRRSRRFPVLVPLHNLRTILATSDADGLADRVSKALQDSLVRVHRSLWRYDSWQHLPPAGSISICRADGAAIRAALRPQAVVPRLVHHLQQTGWPPELETCPVPYLAQLACAHTDSSSPCGASSSTGCYVSTVKTHLSSSTPCTSICSPVAPFEGTGRPGAVAGAGPAMVALPARLQEVLDVCQYRMALLTTQQLPQLQHLRQTAAGPQGLRPQQPQQRCAAAAPAGGGGPCWRPNLPALQAAAAKLPEEATVRMIVEQVFKGQVLKAQEPPSTAASSAALSMRLFWAGVVADPSMLSYSAAGSARQWQQPLTLAARVVATMHTLAEAVGSERGGWAQAGEVSGEVSALQQPISACDGSMQAAWLRAGSAELQLCQSGLQQMLDAVSVEHNPACQPGLVYRCLQALSTAAVEYLSEYNTQGLLDKTSVLSVRQAAGRDDSAALLRCCGQMHTELLRAMCWCMWLVGAL